MIKSNYSTVNELLTGIPEGLSVYNGYYDKFFTDEDTFHYTFLLTALNYAHTDRPDGLSVNPKQTYTYVNLFRNFSRLSGNVLNKYIIDRDVEDVDAIRFCTSLFFDFLTSYGKLKLNPEVSELLGGLVFWDVYTIWDFAYGERPDGTYYWDHAKHLPLAFCGNYDRILQRNNGMNYLAHLLHTKFNDNWVKIYKAILSEYNPIWNVDGTESETYSKATHNEVNSKIETNGTGEVENKRSGYNDDEYVPNDISNTSNGNTVEGNKDDNYSNTTENYTITKTRGGNIGVTMTQQMINAEIDLRIKNNLIPIIFNDIKSFLCNDLIIF